MKKLRCIFLFLTVCNVGFCENLRFTEPFATHIPARADLDVRWAASTNALPASIWVYHLLPRKLSPEMLSNVLAACSLSQKDETTHSDVLIFKSPDGYRQLRVSWPLGIIDYQTTMPRSPTNLVRDVPSKSKALKLAKKLLPELGINLADIAKTENSSQPDFHVFDMGVTYFVDRKPVNNVESRGVRFGRAVDGISFISIGGGGDGEIDFGDHGTVSKMLITWRNMRRNKTYSTLTPQTMIESIRKGKAIQGLIPDNVAGIDWRTVKSVTITKAKPCYYTGGDRFNPSDWLQPYAALWATVDTGIGNIDVEIDCPIIDEMHP